ncbi:hypoxanthine phosphoribosyltransferase [Microscilla marina]|uniref:Hypoxanthine phosphoribosyltransferase n=1 Tax=Microscilla marina ATCC 23134 TaxID=313606 RepID=A1ZR15_MICM2|nr:hypoxanthine phosphoribosyltransferase [Microscilla marina]EAY27104.1 hypoxanthine phosphoribosyltransferase [Microscilla marina ATCC 23134]
MHSVQLKDKTFDLYLSSESIQKEVQRIASEIDKDYAQKQPLLFVAVLNGAFRFMGDLITHMKTPAETAFIKVASYSGVASTGKLTEVMGLDVSLKGKHVVIIEDIVDTGFTMEKLLKQFEAQSPASLEIATLLTKPECLKAEVHPKYVGIAIPDKFVVGYGLDYDQEGRTLNAIYAIK